MATTTPENASDLYKSQITEIALPSPVNKTEAKALTPEDWVKIYPQGTDGGVFIGGTGKAAGYYNDDGTNGSYGTKFKPTGGDGTAGWERDYDGEVIADWFLAGTGLVSDSTAWELIKATGKNAYFPQAQYILDAEVNVTNQIVGRTWRGRGKAFSEPTEVIGNTGAKMFDLSGSGDIIFKDMRLQTYDAAAVTPSTVGIYLARTAVGIAQRNRLENVNITLHTDMTANGNNGTVAVYNNQSEHFGVDSNCDLRGDKGLVFTRNNIYSITSSFVTVSAANSMAFARVEANAEIRSVSDNPALVIQGGTDIQVNGYFVGVLATVSNDTPSIELNECYKCDIRGMIEGHGRVFNILGFTTGLTAKLTHNYARSAVIHLDGTGGNTPSIVSSEINITQLFSGVGAVQPAISSTTAPLGVSDTTLYMYTNQTLACSTSAFQAVVIYAQDNPTIATLANSTNITLHENNNVHLIGSVLNLRDDSGVATAASVFMNFNDSAGTNLGYFGYGSGSTSELQIYNRQSAAVSIFPGGVKTVSTDLSATAGDTRLLIYDVDNGTLERVTVGVADSGGVGFKVLRIPN